MLPASVVVGCPPSEVEGWRCRRLAPRVMQWFSLLGYPLYHLEPSHNVSGSRAQRTMVNMGQDVR